LRFRFFYGAAQEFALLCGTRSVVPCFRFTRFSISLRLVCCRGNTFTSSFDFGEDRVRRGGPDEWLGFALGILDVVTDSLSQFLHAAKQLRGGGGFSHSRQVNEVMATPVGIEPTTFSLEG
jgi:hypothetical protein